jgi:hypothetical protein
MSAAVPALARWLLGLGIAATLAANVARGLGDGPIGAAVAGWPAVALVGSCELLMMVIRSSQAAFDDTSDGRIKGGTFPQVRKSSDERDHLPLAADKHAGIGTYRPSDSG